MTPREVIARAMLVSVLTHVDDTAAAADAALAALEAAGMVIVPRKPLHCMTLAGADAAPGWMAMEEAAEIYRAMIDAARGGSDAAPSVTRDGPVTAIRDPSLPVDAEGILAALRGARGGE